MLQINQNLNQIKMKERYALQQLVPGLSIEASGRLEIVRVANARAA